MAGGGAQGANLAQIAQQLQGAGQPGGSQSMPTQSPMSGYASPNQNFMQYQGQGQPNSPIGQAPPTVGATPQNQNFMQSPDTTGNGEGSSSGFFDGSGSDGGDRKSTRLNSSHT